MTDPRAMLDELERTALLRPDDAALQINLGLARAAAGNLHGALSAFQRASDLRPELAEAHYLLGSAYFQAGNLLVARSCLERSLALRPQFFDALAQLGVVHARLGDLSEAERLFRGAVELSPYHADIHVNLANVLRQQGKLVDAEAEYRRAAALAPDGAMPAYLLGTFLAELGRREEARPALERSTRLAPNALEPWLALGELANLTGDHALAAKCFANALELEHGSEAAWLGAIDAERRQGAWERADQRALEAIASLPAAPSLRRARASLYFDRGDLERAASVLIEAENAGLRTASILAARAVVQRHLGLAEDANRAMQSALELDAGDPDFLNEYARLQMAAGDFNGALQVLEGLLRRNPRYLAALVNLGIVQRQLGREDEARAKFEAVLALDPGNPDAAAHLRRTAQ